MARAGGTRHNPSMRFSCLSLILSFAAISGSVRAQDPGVPPCAADETYVHVRRAEHVLYLCARGQAEGSYPVTLGKMDGAKQREGDHRTPLGRYRLERPRRSDKFRWFVAVGYPSPEQRARGFTGSAVGIHGPPRKLAGLGLRVPGWILALDWTEGCVAVGSDAEIDAIVSWLERTRACTIVID